MYWALVKAALRVLKTVTRMRGLILSAIAEAGSMVFGLDLGDGVYVGRVSIAFGCSRVEYPTFIRLYTSQHLSKTLTELF